MKARPILFSAPMVCALLDDRKTQTRRALPKQPPADFDVASAVTSDGGAVIYKSSLGSPGGYHINCPYGKRGDLLWVRESWTTRQGLDKVRPRDISPLQSVGYLADDEGPWLGKKRPSIFMPKWASRITLEIVDVRVERLQDVSREDATAEGYPFRDAPLSCTPPESWFAQLWRDINGQKAWSDNPWVWVVGFKVHKANVNDFLTNQPKRRMNLWHK